MFPVHILAMVRAMLIVPAKHMVLVAGTRGSWGLMHTMAVLSKVKQQPLFFAVKTFTWFASFGVVALFYLVGDVNINIILVSMLVVGKIINDVVNHNHGMVLTVSRKVRHIFLSFTSPY
jgi:uncharacterized membrane protein